jgi:hypothetical protein
MLKISFSEAATAEKWVLEGRLTPPWLRELRATWKKNHRIDPSRTCIVDLNEVTFIDKGGERLLRMLAKEGAQFIATGVYTKHVLEHLSMRKKYRLLGTLLAGFLAILLAVVVSAPTTHGQNAARNTEAGHNQRCPSSTERSNSRPALSPISMPYWCLL